MSTQSSTLSRIDTPKGRWYQDAESGVYYPSVTTILSVWPKGEAFARWLGNADSYEAAIQKRDEAGERGTIVHDMVGRLLQGDTIPKEELEDSTVRKLLQGFVNFWHEHNPTLVYNEEFLVSKKWGYAGAGDLFIEIGKEVWNMDVKTSSGVYISYHIQTSAYSEAAEEMDLCKVDRRAILWLKPNTKKGWQLVESDESQEKDFSAFLAAKEVWQRENGSGPIIKEEETVEPLSLEQ